MSTKVFQGGDVGLATLKSVKVTTSATPGNVTTITLPDSTRGFRLFPRANDIRFAVGEDPAAESSITAATVATTDFTVGAVAKADLWEARIYDGMGTGRTLRLRSATASVVVDIDIFP